MKNYYLVNGEKYSNALHTWQRILDLKKINKLISYELILQNDKMSSYDWRKETPAIHVMEEEHAGILRDKYTKLVLLYSGGSDSHSILRAFVRAGITLDEIIIPGNPGTTPLAIEHECHTKAKIKWITELHNEANLPIGKITTVTIDDQLINRHFTKDWYLTGSGYSGAESFVPNQWGDWPQYTHQTNEDNTGYILGMEKPRLYANEHIVFMQMNDRITMYGDSNKRNIEWFYFSGDFPQLVSGQCKGVLKAAMTIFPHLSLEEALRELQTNKLFYHTWCQSLGRTSSREQNEASLIHKMERDPLIRSRKFKQWNDHTNEKSAAWANFQDYDKVNKSLNSGEQTPNINTRRYDICHLHDLVTMI